MTVVASRSNGRIADRIERMHRTCLGDLRAAIESSKAQDSIWSRWNAIRYVDTELSARFDRERSAVERLSRNIDANDVTRLWVAGELVTMLRGYLRASAGLCHRAAEFATVSGKLLKAVEYWFAAVEDVVGPLSLDDLPAQVRQDLGLLGSESGPCRCTLGVGVTGKAAAACSA